MRAIHLSRYHLKVTLSYAILHCSTPANIFYMKMLERDFATAAAAAVGAYGWKTILSHQSQAYRLSPLDRELSLNCSSFLWLSTREWRRVEPSTEWKQHFFYRVCFQVDYCFPWRRFATKVSIVSKVSSSSTHPIHIKAPVPLSEPPKTLCKMGEFNPVLHMKSVHWTMSNTP